MNDVTRNYVRAVPTIRLPCSCRRPPRYALGNVVPVELRKQYCGDRRAVSLRLEKIAWLAMKPILMGAALLIVACGVSAQGENAGRTNAGAVLSVTSATRVLVTMGTDSSAPANAAADAAPEPSPAAHPAPTPRYIFGDRDDYRWQLSDGLEYFHFHSKVFDCNMLGPNATLTYYTNNWFAVEGDVLAVFSPNTVIARDHGKLVGALGGFRIGGRRARWEPWSHASFGWSHLQPQTADGGRNTIMAIAGVGLDYRLNSRWSLQSEGDYVYTRYFSQSQSNFQISGGVVMHF
jgi:hypothetical protein